MGKKSPEITMLRLMTAQISALNEKMEQSIQLMEASLDAIVNLGAEIAYSSSEQDGE